MNLVKKQEAVFGASTSAADANKFYTILLDARGSTASENMYDVAEKLLNGEKENAKQSLEQLWALKKNLQNEQGAATIDLLLQYYQEKIDVLRTKEEKIKRVSTDSRKLLEEKRKKDSEIATVKQEIGDCTRGMAELKGKLDKLSVREQELTLIEAQLQKELQTNANEIVNGLYEIILAQKQGGGGLDIPFAAEEDRDVPAAKAAPEIKAPAAAGLTALSGGQVHGSMEEAKPAGDEPHIDCALREKIEKIYRQFEEAEQPVYPKSVVKTTRGTVIGEYFYDAKVYKNRRHYIFNSRFFLEQLKTGAGLLKSKFDQEVYADCMQMIQDGYKRITGSTTLHFEIATNEILNEKTLKELWQNLKSRSYADIEKFCGKLQAKLDAMAANQTQMLKEQMARLVSQ